MQFQINVLCAFLIAIYGGLLGAMLLVVYLAVCSGPR